MMLSVLSCGAASLPEAGSSIPDPEYNLSQPATAPTLVPSAPATPVHAPPAVVPAPSAPVQEVAEPVAPVVIPVAHRPAYGVPVGELTVERFGEATKGKEIIQGGAIPKVEPGVEIDEAGCRIEKFACPMDPILARLSSTQGSVTAHYPNSAMPGGEGNVAIAGHRGGYDSFTMIHALEAGDTAVIKTADGTYTYRFLWRDDHVAADDHDALTAKVFRTQQRVPGEEIGKALMLTACGLPDNNPAAAGDVSYRVFAYFEYESFTPH